MTSQPAHHARDTNDRPRTIALAPPGQTTGGVEPPVATSDQTADPLFDVTLLADYARFLGHAVRRHAMGALASLLLLVAAVAVVVTVWPRTYQVDGRLLVQRSSLVSSLVNPDRAMARDGDGPTVGAQEVVHSRDNLLAIMNASDLISEWARTRSLLLRGKDLVMGWMAQTPTEDQHVDAMVGLLESRLQVGTGDEGTVNFVLKWPDPVMAQKIVDLAMQRYLEHRRVTEISAITDSISILDKSASAVEAQVAATLNELPRTASGSPGRPRPVRRPVVTGPPAEATVRLARLRSALEAREQEVARLDGARTQQLA